MGRRVIVLGKGGMLGSMVVAYLSQRGHAVTALGRDAFDAEKEEANVLHERLSLTKEDVIVNAIAVTDASEVSEDVLRRVNTRLPHGLDALAATYGCTVIHTSTDGVFSGIQGGYWESLPPDATDPYGRSKAEGDQLSHSIVLRTSLIGPESGKHRHLLSWTLSQKETIRGYTNHTWNGITTLSYAKILEHFLTDGFPEPGLYHIFSPHILTKYDLLRAIARTYETGLMVTPHHAPASVMRHLVSEKTLSESLMLPDIELQLTDMRAYTLSKNVWKST
jgi:dTDP-4-dehydrorhamnose reductase